MADKEKKETKSPDSKKVATEAKRKHQEYLLEKKLYRARLVHGEAIAGHLRLFCIQGVPEKIRDSALPRILPIEMGTDIVDKWLKDLDTSQFPSKKDRAKEQAKQKKKQEDLRAEMVAKQKAVRATLLGGKKQKRRGRLLGE